MPDYDGSVWRNTHGSLGLHMKYLFLDSGINLDTMLLTYVGVQISGLKWECHIGTKLGLGRCDGCTHEAGRRVGDQAYGFLQKNEC